MSYDLTTSIVEGWAESLQGEGGLNRFLNCLPTTLANMLHMTGQGEWEPQDILDKAYSLTEPDAPTVTSWLVVVAQRPWEEAWPLRRQLAGAAAR